MQRKSNLPGSAMSIQYLFVSTLLAFSIISIAPDAGAQYVKKNADGTVEVGDEEPTTTSSSAQAPRASAKASGASRKGAARSGGRIPAYTKRMGGVTIKRHADGTIDVVDETEHAPPSRRASGHGSSTSYGNGQAITRHPDGTVDVVDTTMAPAPSSRKGSHGTIGSYKHSYSDVTVKRNADGTVDVIDTSPGTKKSSKK